FAGATLGAYFLLGLASYVAERRGRYRPWMSWLTVTGDCAFLHLSLWLALGNTGLAGGYLVALPSIWLAPAVLAFGALRFNPLLQAYVLVLVAAGFGAMGAVGFVPPLADHRPPPAALNLFFSPPPNVMRLAMLALAGVVLVVASLRARRLLARSIAETRRRMNLTRYLPQEIAGRLAEGGLDELRRGERRQVAVLFVDVRDFTRLTETMAPEAIGALATDFRRRV
ncbi:MAG: adenylate/guanylate cyclase domain-containing protein, partial [Alphaproteobacteria bacterium]